MLLRDHALPLSFPLSFPSLLYKGTLLVSSSCYISCLSIASSLHWHRDGLGAVGAPAEHLAERERRVLERLQPLGDAAVVERAAAEGGRAVDVGRVACRAGACRKQGWNAKKSLSGPQPLPEGQKVSGEEKARARAPALSDFSSTLRLLYPTWRAGVFGVWEVEGVADAALCPDVRLFRLGHQSIRVSSSLGPPASRSSRSFFRLWPRTRSFLPVSSPGCSRRGKVRKGRGGGGGGRREAHAERRLEVLSGRPAADDAHGEGEKGTGKERDGRESF